MSDFRPDPNWLFSSMAQSAAAVFAIVGGFIATRVITLASERAGVTAQLAETTTTIDLLHRQERQLWAERDDITLYRALSGVRLRLVETDKAAPFEEVLNAPESISFQEHDLLEAYNRLLRDYGDAKRFVEQHQDKVNVHVDAPDFYGWLHRTGVVDYLADAELDLELVQAVYQRELGIKQAPVTTFGIKLPAGWGLTGSPVRDTLEEVRARLEEVEGRLKDAEVRRQLLRERLAQLQPPPNIWWAFAILGYIGAVGVILPLALLPADSATTSVRVVTVGMFTLGLVALGVYMAIQVSPLAEWRSRISRLRSRFRRHPKESR